ncbi:MAG: hypothetical protein OXC84_05555 [Gammaproteobacteria bacterium]|nr:hypothetical protein [Gammaproteobacteria bacterium]
MSRWDEPMGKVETEMTPREVASVAAQKRILKDFDDGVLTKEEVAKVYQGNWIDYGVDA